jgi:hypothetical protein
MTDPIAAPQKYIGIWQARTPHESEFIQEILGPYISEYVTDGKHELVLDNSILLDAFSNTRGPAYYARFRGKNAFLVHFLDENYEGGYEEIYENFRGVFRCFWSDVFNPQRIMKMPLGYNNGLDLGRKNLVPASQRKYVWSFLGGVNKSSRPDMARELIKVVPNFFFATDDVPGFIVHNKLDGMRRKFPHAEYAEFMFESSFSPCPMGNANLECYRVYEALESGSIPIVEKRPTLDYFYDLLGDHPIPTVSSWAEARRRIAELLASPQQLDALQQRCIAWWRQYKLDYTMQAGQFLAARSADGGEGLGPVVSAKQHRPGWRTIELLRHHDRRAVARRVKRQIDRLIRTGSVREAYRKGAPPS